MNSVPQADLDPSPIPPPTPSRIWALFWLPVLIGHALIAGLWWVMMPGGFPFHHPRFWVNQVLPPIALVLAIAAMVALHRRQREHLRVLLPIWPAFWIAASLSGRLTFPITAARLWTVPFVGAILLTLTLWPLWRRPRPSWPAWMAVGVALVLGLLLPPSQAAPRSGTRPRNDPLPTIEPARLPDESPLQGLAILRPDVAIHAGDASLTVKRTPLTFEIDPLLRFESRSPDGCWTVFARAIDREPIPFSFRQGARGDKTARLAAEATGLGAATLRVDASQDGAVEIDAHTRLDQVIDSHLNDYVHIAVSGHQSLALEFSPCPGIPVEVLPFDYPRGRPARFAYLDAHGLFRVVEATSGEKGPFRTLASGRLDRGAPLTLTFHDADRPIARLTLDDWSAQLGTALSPTAGWGVPVNAIEFHRRRMSPGGDGDSPTTPCDLFFTLAGTSVGRGWDSVAHAPGVYRNRLRLTMIKP